MLPMLWPTEMRNACGNWLRFNNGEDPTPKQFTYNTLSRALISLNTFLVRAFCSLRGFGVPSHTVGRFISKWSCLTRRLGASVPPAGFYVKSTGIICGCSRNLVVR